MTTVIFLASFWKKAWIFSIFIGILVSVVEYIQYHGLLSKIFISAGAQSGSTIGNPIFLGIYLLLLFFPTLAFAIKEPFDTARSKALKIFYIFSLLVFLYTIFIAQSRASYLGILAGIICFFLLYPKKLRVLKISIGVLLVFIFSLVFYVNTQTHFPAVLQKNSTFLILQDRLSLQQVLQDERFRAWQTAFKEVLDRPVLGWGPENLAVGFDKNYNPNVTWSPWWDKAHNIFLDIGAETGFAGITAYILLFVALFWQLAKHKKDNPDAVLICALQATLVGYLVANFFSFDSMPTYLIFFFIIGYALYLTKTGSADENKIQKDIKGKNLITAILFLSLVIFLWQYNLAPFQINEKINIANNYSASKACDQYLNLLGQESSNHSFLDSYLIMQYIRYESKKL